MIEHNDHGSRAVNRLGALPTSACCYTVKLLFGDPPGRLRQQVSPPPPSAGGSERVDQQEHHQCN